MVKAKIHIGDFIILMLIIVHINPLLYVSG